MRSVHNSLNELLHLIQ